MDPRLAPVASALALAQSEADRAIEQGWKAVQDARERIQAQMDDMQARIEAQIQVIASLTPPQLNLLPVSDALLAVAFPPEVMFTPIVAPTEDSGQTANQAIQDAIYNASSPMFLPAGRYLVDAEDPIKLKSGLALYLHPDAVLVVKANGAPRYYVFLGEGVEDVLIQGGQILGDRITHDYSAAGTHEWGMGIGLRRGCKRITLRKVTVRACTGDGFSLAGEDLHVIDCVSLYNRRQGLSLFTARCVRIIRGEYAFTGKPIPGTSGLPAKAAGTKPMAAIDVEPDSGDVDDVLIDGAWIHDNESSGVLAWSRSGTGVDLRGLRLRRCIIERNSNGVEAAGYGGSVYVDVRTCILRKNTGAAAKAMTGATITFGGQTDDEANEVFGMAGKLRSQTPGRYDLQVRSSPTTAPPGVIVENLNYYQ